MKNQIIKTPTKGKEYFGFNDTDLVVSSKKHQDIDSLMGAIEKKGMLETISHVPISNIVAVKYNEKNEVLAIKYKKDTKEKTFKISFDSAETRNSIASSISEIKGLNKNLTAEGKVKPLLINLLFVAFAIMAAVVFVGIANEAAHGGEVTEFSGRRSGMKNILVSICVALGPIGVGIIGGLGTLLLVWRAVKRWQNPGNDVLFS